MKLTKYMMAAMAVSFLTVSCGDDDSYSPGEPTADDCMKVYFSNDNPSSFIFGPDDLGDDYSVDIVLCREVADKEADIPVIVTSAAECMEIPATAHFDADETETTLKVSFPNIPSRIAQKFDIHIPDEYIDFYNEELGVGRYIGSIVVSEWIRIVNDAEFFDSNYKQFFNYSDIFWLAGVNKFRFENFLESGIDLTFKISNPAFDPDNIKTWNGYVIPLDNYSGDPTLEGSGYNNCKWYLFNDATGAKPKWVTYMGATQNNLYFNSTEAYFPIDFAGDWSGYSGYLGKCVKSNSTRATVWIYGPAANPEGVADDDYWN